MWMLVPGSLIKREYRSTFCSLPVLECDCAGSPPKPRKSQRISMLRSLINILVGGKGDATLGSSLQMPWKLILDTGWTSTPREPSLFVEHLDPIGMERKTFSPWLSPDLTWSRSLSNHPREQCRGVLRDSRMQSFWRGSKLGPQRRSTRLKSTSELGVNGSTCNTARAFRWLPLRCGPDLSLGSDDMFKSLENTSLTNPFPCTKWVWNLRLRKRCALIGYILCRVLGCVDYPHANPVRQTSNQQSGTTSKEPSDWSM